MQRTCCAPRGWGFRWGGKYYLWLIWKGRCHPISSSMVCSWGNPEHFQNPLGFHIMVLEETPFSKGECTHPKKEKWKLFKGSRMNFWLFNPKWNGHKMAAEAKILEWTVARVLSRQELSSKEYKTIIKVIRKWDNKIMSPAHHPPKSEAKR